MATFELDPNWEARGFLDGTKYTNHESTLSGEEMKTLAAQTINIPGFSTIAAPAAGNDPFYDMSQALQSPGATIEVVKGIHQRDGSDHEVHFTLRIKGNTRQYHVFVGEGATGTQRVSSPSGKTYHDRLIFKYKCTGISFVKNKTIHTFPAVFAKTGVRARGHSFSAGNTKPVMGSAEMIAAKPFAGGTTAPPNATMWLNQ